MSEIFPPVHIIGGGLAGSEACWQLVCRGIPVVMHEMRPSRQTEAHCGDDLAELVCSNSFRADDATANAVGLLHEEMRRAGSLIISCADATRVPAGGALAVDREAFAAKVTQTLVSHPMVTLERKEVCDLPPEEWGTTLIATGPLTSPSLAQSLSAITGEDNLSFFDAIAPIIHKDSIDFSKAWYQSRYDKGTGTDYINCPLNEEQYTAFIEALLAGEKTEFKEWERTTPYFEGCLPIEVMVERGRETLRYGPMKPVGLSNPNGPKPHAVVQLRQDNALGTLYNIVGFQTKLKHREQIRIFRMIPGLEDAEFARLGGIHRNTFLNSPLLLNETLQLKTVPRLRFAGQITGCEGYVESSAIGLLSGRFLAAERLGLPVIRPPATTAFGALLHHITSGANAKTFQPMNITFGLFPDIDHDRDQKGHKIKGRDRKKLYSDRALKDLAQWLGNDSLSALS